MGRDESFPAFLRRPCICWACSTGRGLQVRFPSNGDPVTEFQIKVNKGDHS